MYFPKLNAPRQSRVTVNRFPGLDRRPRGQEGSFREMENLCAQGYPTLTVRCPRGIAGSVTAPGGLTAKDGLIWVDGHTLYINGSATGLVLSEGKKQLVSMGAWLLIWPDKLYINTKDLTDFGSLENKRVTEGEVSFTLCRPDGTAYSGYLAADTAPEEPESGSLWLDTGGEETALRQYGQDGWTEVDDVCVGLHAAGIGVGLPGRGRRIRQRVPGGGAERQLPAAGRRGGLPGGDGAARRAVVPDGAGDGGAVRAGHGLCGGKRQPAVGVQIRHRGRPGGERRLCQQAGGLQKLELLRGTVHRQLRGLPGLRREVHRGRRTIWEVRCFSRKTAWSGCIPAPTGPIRS